MKGEKMKPIPVFHLRWGNLQNPLRKKIDCKSLPVVYREGMALRELKAVIKFYPPTPGCQCYSDCDCYSDYLEAKKNFVEFQDATFYRLVEYDGTDKQFVSKENLDRYLQKEKELKTTKKDDKK